MKIQRKVFLIFTTVITVFVCAGISVNCLFLEKYYIYKEKKQLAACSIDLTEKMTLQSNGLEDYIAQYGKKEHIRIVILDSDLQVTMTSYYRRKDNSNVPLKKIQRLVKQKGSKQYICKVYSQKKQKTSQIFCLLETGDGAYIVCQKNTKGVKESAMAANEFYVMIGIGMILFGSGVMAVFSRKITEPIVKMNRVTAAMSQLCFEERLEEKGNDEIGELARNINCMSEKLSASMDMLQQDVLRRKQLIRDLSHELKTPIAVIKGYTEGMCYGLAENQQEREQYGQIITEECDRMDRMIRDMLELSKLEQVRVELECSEVAVYPFVEAHLAKYSVQIERKQCAVRNECLQNDHMYADPALFERVFDNLVSNALRHVTQQGEIVISFRSNESENIFSVYNSGSGIPENMTDRLWDAFYKADASRKREDGGHGIGLAIVKAAVELQGGMVFVRNEKQGVVFGCSFPKTSR